MNILIASLSVQQLRRAADLKEEIQSLEVELGQILGSSTKPAVPKEPKHKRKMSSAGRARIAAGARARWAKVKGTQPEASPQPKKKGGMSAAGKARIVAAQKLRWARIRAAKAAKAVLGKPARKKSKISSEGLARIIAATKLRWARVRAAQAAKKK